LQKEGISADAIHGDKSQKERIEALDAFKAGKISALVATDVAARGLDISELPMVINYEIPSAPEDYVHRIGRTGRAGASGVAISLICEDEDKYFADIEKLIKKSITKQQANISKRATAAERHAPTERHTLSDNRTSATPRPRHAKANAADAWFNKPYEPSGQEKILRQKAVNLSKRPVAALLGGLKRD
jgi:superfamily II DNA/RNA helicase